MRRRRRPLDLTPTIAVAVTALTAYMVYVSLKLDGVSNRQIAAKAEREEQVKHAAEATAAVRDKSDRRNRQLGIAIGVCALFAAVAQIKGFPWI